MTNTHKYMVLSFQVAVHAHDRNASICTVVGEQEGVSDALDTWHSGKEVLKAMKKITSGAVKWSGIKYIFYLYFYKCLYYKGGMVNIIQ